MVASGEEVLVAGPKERSIDELEISPVVTGSTKPGSALSATSRSLTTCPTAKGRRASLGGLMGRSYEALFAAEDECALAVAVFLLWHVAANRRRANRPGSLARGRIV